MGSAATENPVPSEEMHEAANPKSPGEAPAAESELGEAKALPVKGEIPPPSPPSSSSSSSGGATALVDEVQTIDLKPTATVEDVEAQDKQSSLEVLAALRKVDLRVLPFLSFCYLTAYLDRSNIANARIMGDNAMEKELNVSDSQMNLSISIFYVGYILLEVPSNLMLKKASPSSWLALIMLTWGIACCSMGAVTNAGGLIALRALLGVFEAGFVPGVIFYLTFWYLPKERSWRIGLFLCAAAVANFVGSLLASAIELMDGIAGLSAWRWIFIIEGLPTAICGLVCYLYLPNSPSQAKFLTEHERNLLLTRLNLSKGVDAGAGGDDGEDHSLDKREIVRTFMDPKMYLFCFAKFCTLTPMLGFTYSFPLIMVELGFRDMQALLLGAPVYLTAFIACLVVSRLSDRYQTRSGAVLLMNAGTFLGFLGMLVLPTPGLKYAAAFLVPTCLQSASPPLLAWITSASAHGSSTYVAIATAMSLGIGNSGGLFAAYFFPKSDAPNFPMGYGICMALVVCCAASTLVLRRSLGRLGRPT